MLRTTAKSNPKKALSSANMLSRTLKNERQDQMDYALLLFQKKINHISSSFVLLGLLDDYWGQRAFVDRESRVGREDNSMTVGIVCQDDRQAVLSTYTFTYLSYSVWFATEYIGYLLPLPYISSLLPDLLTCTHIFVMRKGLINIYTYLHRLQLGQK